MNNELISIIVPIYNKEDYLRQCLDSIINQSYTNFEVLLVNDGSTDSSGIICQEYSERDSRFRYIEKKNGGVSSARNLGLELSEGAYITFIDSDDWIEFNYLEVLYNALRENNTDVAISSYKSYYLDGNFYLRVYSSQEEEFLRIGKRNRDVFLEEFPKLGKLNHDFHCIASKLFKRELLESQKFDESINYGEDLYFFFNLYLKIQSIIYVKEATYIYRQHGTNITLNFTESLALQEIQIHEQILKSAENQGIASFYYLEKLKYIVSLRIEQFPYSDAIKKYETIVSDLENRVTYPQPLISLIVPIYNVENYLWMCLDSIAKQTYSNIEVVLINDGSSDGSKEICQEFVNRDNRFRYFEKNNGGLSDARNVGIIRSQGEFISFIDSDDWIDSTYVEDLYKAALLNDSEVVVSNYKEFHNEQNVYLIHFFDDYYERNYNGEELIQQLPFLERKDLSFTTSWGILFSRRLFECISFPKGKNIEDTRTNYRLFAESYHSTYIHKSLYNYRVGLDSISGNINEKLLIDVFECLTERMAIYAMKDWNVTEEKKNILSNLQMRYQQAKEAGLEDTDIFKRYTEYLNLLNK
ncbi:glycosyltransferase family 2 protein [Streptococcus mitis]|jgi:glycosyl transferase, family 2/glycosyl transferase family 8|uniref:glycosyltransferase family 2 protein n=1 Tax=Streptococcus mitis TaxID=28037 RepID=UPI0021B80450|nr:glycosyltransferase [Streptococcus mitis]